MADPLSITASVLAVSSAAIVSIRSLCDTVKGFRNRNNTLRRLQDKLQDLVVILDALAQVTNADVSIIRLLEGPVSRCKEVCKEFEQSMKKFHGKSKTGLLDWTKLEFMKGDINDFIDTVEGYKSTITVGLGTINLRNSTVSYEVLSQYEEMIKDTAYNLEVHLQQIDDRLARYCGPDITTSDTGIDLQDEKAVTQQCLRICKNASSYIETLAARESPLLQDTSQVDAGQNAVGDFEARVLTLQALSASQATFVGVIKHLGDRLQSVVRNSSTDNESERLRLQDDINMSKQGLQLCKIASEISQQKIHTVGQAIAEDNSDQVVVTTFADLFDVKKAVSKGHSAQLVATLTPDNFDHVVEKRYNSRFGAIPDASGRTQAESNTSTTQGPRPIIRPEVGKQPPSNGPEAGRVRPNPNEMRKRRGESDPKPDATGQGIP